MRSICSIKAGFHYGQSRSRNRSRSRSRKRPYDPVKIENRSRKRISSTESERFHFFRLGLQLRRLRPSENWVVGVESRSGRTNKSQGSESNIVIIGLFFRFCLRLRQCSFHLIASDGAISRITILLPTPSVWFSLDRITQRFWLRLRLRLP